MRRLGARRGHRLVLTLFPVAEQQAVPVTGTACCQVCQVTGAHDWAMVSNIGRRLAQDAAGAVKYMA